MDNYWTFHGVNNHVFLCLPSISETWSTQEHDDASWNRYNKCVNDCVSRVNCNICIFEWFNKLDFYVDFSAVFFYAWWRETERKRRCNDRSVTNNLLSLLDDYAPFESISLKCVQNYLYLMAKTKANKSEMQCATK